MLIGADSGRFTAPRGFIVIEGPNGSGKSTLIRTLAERLTKAGKTVRATFEPGDSPHGKELRRLLLGSSPALEPLSELLLFAADRHEHVRKVVIPALNRGEFVICDRYIYSTIAFQGFGRALPMERINELNSIATEGLVPDLVILLDCPVELGLARTRTRAPQGEDSFEAEELAFHERLRQGFLEIAKTRPEPFLVIDAAKSPEEVSREAWGLVQKVAQLT